MFLQNLLPTKKNSGVLVNGTVYKIAEDCVIRDSETGEPVDVPEEDSNKLLQNLQAWREWDGKSKLLSETRAKYRVGPSGNRVLDTRDEEAKKEEVVEEPPKEEAPKEVVKEEAQDGGDPPIPTSEDEEWSDPKEEYSIDWIKACADAYDIEYKGNISKKKLIKRIKATMYE